MTAAAKSDLDLQAEKLERHLPAFAAGPLRWLRTSSPWIRIPLAVLLIAGGFVSFLPVLGFWMLPLGLVLIARDLPFLEGPLARLFARIERRWKR